MENFGWFPDNKEIFLLYMWYKTQEREEKGIDKC